MPQAQQMLYGKYSYDCEAHKPKFMADELIPNFIDAFLQNRFFLQPQRQCSAAPARRPLQLKLGIPFPKD